MHLNVHSSTIYYSQMLEATSVPVSMWVDQKTVVYLHDGILSSWKKEGALTPGDQMDGTEEHHAKWSKSGGKRQIPYDLTFNRNLINKTNKQAKYNKATETENRLTVTREERGGNFRRKGWRVCRNNYKGHTITGWGVEMGGRWEGLGVGLGWGEKAENCTRTTIKNFLKCLCLFSSWVPAAFCSHHPHRLLLHLLLSLQKLYVS